MSDVFTTPPRLITCVNEWFSANDVMNKLRAQASQRRVAGDISYNVTYTVVIAPRHARVLSDFSEEQVRAVIENEISNVADFNEQLNVIRYIEPSHVVGELELSLHVREPYYGWTY